MIKNIVLFGCRELGFEVATALRSEKRQLRLYDHQESCVEQAKRLGFEADLVAYDNDRALMDIGIGQDVDFLFALLEEDSENVFLCLSARTLDNDLRIMSISESSDAHDKLIAAGANKVIDPYLLSAYRIHQMMKRPLVVETLEQTLFGRQDLELAEVIIPKSSPVKGMRLSQLALEETFNLILIGIVDLEISDKLMFNTHSIDHRLDCDDILIVVGRDAQIKAFQRYLKVSQSS